MIALTILALIVLYLVLLVKVTIKSKNWKTRLGWWAVLLALPAYYTWDYQSIRIEHMHACKKEGGLKIFIQPEKTDRIRLDGKTFGEREAKEVLVRFWPRLQLVGAQDSAGILGTGYYAYTIDPSSTDLPKSDWKINKVKLGSLSDDFYVVTKDRESDGKNRDRTVWRLSRNGQIYAQWTSLEYYWSRQWLYASTVGWRCFVSGLPEDEILTELILK